MWHQVVRTQESYDTPDQVPGYTFSLRASPTTAQVFICSISEPLVDDAIARVARIVASTGCWETKARIIPKCPSKRVNIDKNELAMPMRMPRSCFEGVSMMNIS